jgi:hypothetical protein
LVVPPERLEVDLLRSNVGDVRYGAGGGMPPPLETVLNVLTLGERRW